MLQVIDELEAVLPFTLLALTAVRRRGPGAVHTLPYIHVLRVDPHSRDEEGADVWPAAAAQLGVVGPGVAAGGGDASVGGGGGSVRGSSPPRPREPNDALPRPVSSAASLGVAGADGACGGAPWRRLSAARRRVCTSTVQRVGS